MWLHYLSRFCCSLFLFLFHYCCFFSVCTYLCLCCITFLLLYKPVSAPFSDSCLCVSVCVFVIACMVMFLFVLLFLLLFEGKFFGRNQSREMKRNLGRNKNGICAHFYLALEKYFIHLILGDIYCQSIGAGVPLKKINWWWKERI